MAKRFAGIHELYARDPEKADWQVFGRKPEPVSRRGFLKGLPTMTAVLGGTLVFGHNMPAGLIPAALAQSEQPFQIEGKDPGLTILNDRPVNAETPAHLLDDPVTPADKLFVRNNGLPPEKIDPAAWRLTIDGESAAATRVFSIDDLKNNFENVRYRLTLECGGNGRSEFSPPARGNQWTLGAVGCPEWSGVRLRDVLNACGLKENAVYIGFYGADRHLSGDPAKHPISRGVPVHKALQPESMIAWGINGQDLPLMNGHPLRLVFGGWPGSTSGKWLTRIVVRDRIHDGEKMTGTAYRMPCFPVGPGEKVDDEDMCIIEAMPVKSLITFPRSGALHKLADPLEVRGHAWSGEASVSALHISIDFGQTWTPAQLDKPHNPYAWQRWKASIRFPKKGYYEIWARATDSDGQMQPMVLPGWNPKGYLNNACHRIAVRAMA